MQYIGLVFLCTAIAGTVVNTRNKRQSVVASFPPDFGFGASTASYQTEGAWDEDGKGWSMWDYLVRTDPGHIADNSTGDIAGNSYHNYKRDVQMLKELGATHYRFSISWPRILPYGRANYVEPRGIAHYNDFINDLLANDIIPFVTMYHWDLPQNLNEQGGWTNEEIVDWFGDYARILYQNFGDRVKYWLTINEPYVHCNFGYAVGIHAPRLHSPGVLYYECGRNILLANARAYQIYNEEFRSVQNGQVGIVLSSDWAYPASDLPEDLEATEDYIAFHLRQFADPIFSQTGNYPQRMIDRVQAASTAEGHQTSRLRPFTQEQIDSIRGSSDFLALNHYTSKYAYRNSSLAGTFEVPSHANDAFLSTYMDDSWTGSESLWLKEHAPGLYHLLVYIKEHYNNPTIYITENGFSAPSGLIDETRVQYHRNYLNSVLDALNEGVDVRGYFAWSLMDNFEWAMGYTQKFGLYEVDMNDPERTRTPRKSAFIYKEIISSRIIDYDYNPDPYDTDGASAEHAPGLYHLLVYIKEHYNNPTIYITENGFSVPSGLIDETRVQYHRNYLNSVLDALNEGVDVRGYFAWSLMDNFEWAMGYTQKFGLYEVDMNDPERTRTPRKSAMIYKEIISSRIIDYDYNPDPYDTDGASAVTSSILLVAVLNVLL